MGWGGWPKDIHYAFFGNVVRGKRAPLRLVVENGFAHFVQKVFARRKLLPGKFWVFAPLQTAWFLSYPFDFSIFLCFCAATLYKISVMMKTTNHLTPDLSYITAVSVSRHTL